MSPFDLAASVWLAWVVAASWRATLLATILWGLDRLVLRRCWPSLRHGLWLLVPASLIVPPAGGWLWAGLLPDSPLLPHLDAVAPAAATPSAWPVWLFGVWAIGLIATMTVTLIRSRRQARRLLGAGTEPDARLEAAATRAAELMGLRRPAAIRVGCEVPGPLVFGWPRPVVVLPREALSHWSPRELEHILCHELAHVRRGDLHLEVIVGVVTRLFWFHPLVHLARRKAREARELCCDLTVASRVGGGYRRTLARVAGETLLAPPAPGLAGFLTPASHLLWRLRALSRFESGEFRDHRLASAALLGTIACAVLPPPPAGRAALADARAEALAAVRGKPAGYSSMQARMAILRLNALEAESRAVTSPPTLPESR